MRRAKDGSDWADAQADLSPSLGAQSFCWFCHEAAQLYELTQEQESYSHNSGSAS